MYSRCYGLAPGGAHRIPADDLLREIRGVKCAPCAGTGYRIVGDEEVRDCWLCAGTGIATECWDAIARVRAQVIEAYPESARPYPPERSSAVWQLRSAPVPRSSTGGVICAFVQGAICVPIGLGGGVSVLHEGRIIDGLFLLYFGGVMAFMALVGANVVTLRPRTGRVVLVVLLAVLVVLFVLVMVHGVANMPD